MPVDNKINSMLPEYMFKDPVLTLLSLPLIPFMLINSIIMSGMPKITTTIPTEGYYKNDEEWEMYEKSGRLVIKVHRNAQRK